MIFIRVVDKLKIFTDTQFEELISKLTDEITDTVIKEIQSKSFQSGYDAGYEFGLREGLTTNKTGVYFCKSGMFIFEDGELKKVEKSL